jgi:hypothetical protein
VSFFFFNVFVCEDLSRFFFILRDDAVDDSVFELSTNYSFSTYYRQKDKGIVIKT